MHAHALQSMCMEMHTVMCMDMDVNMSTDVFIDTYIGMSIDRCTVNPAKVGTVDGQTPVLRAPLVTRRARRHNRRVVAQRTEVRAKQARRSLWR